MTSAALLLAVLLATLCRTQTVFESKNGYNFWRAIGSLLLLLLPLGAMYVTPDLGQKWRNYFYHVSFALSCVLMVARVSDWEKLWPLTLVWPMLHLVYTNDHLGLWLAMITAEFLLLFAYQTMDPRSDYYKYGLLRLLLIFQFFVFEHLFLQARPLWAGEILSGMLILFYVLALIRIVSSIKRGQLLPWLFLVAYLQYGVMMFDKILIEAFKLVT